MSLERWVNDELHDVLGFSDRLTVDFLIASAKRSSTLEKFLGSLQDADLDLKNPKVARFGTELYNKVNTVFIRAIFLLRG